MIGICLGMATVIQVAIPSSEITLAWTHSIEKIRWEEDYRVEYNQLKLTTARIKGSGAGMEIPDDALSQNGWWYYQPRLAKLNKLILTRSNYTADYEICWNQRCQSLEALLGPFVDSNNKLEVFPCAISPLMQDE